MSEENLGGSEIKQSLDLIQQAVLTLDKKIEAQGKRIEQLEKQAYIVAPVQNFQQPNLSSSATPPPPPPLAMVQEQKQASVHMESPAKSQDSLEENIGGKWFARIGITALILGVSFFLKYAFDNDWIGETGRVMIGVLIGLILLGIGEKTIRKYSLYGQIISGGGIAVLYLSIFSAFNFYHIIDSYVAFFIMIIITICGIVLSIRYDALSLMMVAIIGGFATPIMASTGQNNQFGLLSYITLLDLAILIIAVFKKWRGINIVGFAGTVILFLSWGDKFYTRQDLGETMFFLTIFFLLFSVSSLIYNVIKKEKSAGTEQILTLFSAIAYFTASYILLDKDYHASMGFFALILAGYYFLWAFLVRNLIEEDKNLYAFLAFLAVGFITLAIPIQFKQNVITISWAIEAILLMIIGTKLKKAPIIVFSIIVAALTLFRYFIFDVTKYDQFTLPIFNNIFFTSVLIIIAAYLIAYIIRVFLKEDLQEIRKKSLITLFIIVANFVTIFSISQEIFESYNRDIQAAYADQNIAQQKSFNATSGNSKVYDQVYKKSQSDINSLKNKSSISLSIFWLIYSICLLAVGIVGKYKGVRFGGLALLLLAILKLFFVDLWSLGTLYRIISSISLGVVLLSISFVYQKYKDKIKEMI